MLAPWGGEASWQLPILAGVACRCVCPASLGLENRCGLIWSRPTSRAQIWNVYYKITASLGSSSVSFFPLSSHHSQGLWAAAAITQTDQGIKNGAKYNCLHTLLWCAQAHPWRRGWCESVIEKAFPPQTKWVRTGRKRWEGTSGVTDFTSSLPLPCPASFPVSGQGQERKLRSCSSAIRQSTHTCCIFQLKQHCDSNITYNFFSDWDNL